MTIQKAIEELQLRIDLIDSDYPELNEYKKCLQMLVNALQKQIDLKEMLQQFYDDRHPEYRYSETLVIELLESILIGDENNDKRREV